MRAPMRILMWNDYGEMKILANKKVYHYNDISWSTYRKLQKWIDKKWYGKVWKCLN